jgi:aryl-alcohol dehydrogenase-like predicted oxidoreductase
MDYGPLGRTGIEVSRICLGTMTFGEQNNEAEGHAQLDAALQAGVNFIDTAEMYPIAARAETFGRTEIIIGTWLRARKCRDKVILATKICGPAPHLPYIRGGNIRHDRRQLEEALDASLKRLGTDYVDLYQIHWPDRLAVPFASLGYVHDEELEFTPPEETLAALADQVKAGKVRAIGLSNDTPWGVMKYVELAEGDGLPRVASVQNPYSLLNRTFEVGLAEVALREDCGLLAYSPLGFGTLTGKYLNGAEPEGARLSLFPQFARYSKPRGIEATRAYVDLARRHALDAAQMAIAFTLSRRFVTSTIIGATTVEQLGNDLAAAELELAAEVEEAIEAIHADNPNPAP